MKILHVISSLSTEHGGPTVFLRDLISRHVNDGHSVSVVSASIPSYGFESHSQEVARLSSLGTKVYSFTSITFYRISLRLFFWSFHNLGKYDVIHIHSLYRYPVDIVLLMCVLRRLPVLLSPHGSLDPYLHSKSSFGAIGLAFKGLYHTIYRLVFPKVCFHFTTQEEMSLAENAVPIGESVVIPIGIPLNNVVYGYTGSLRNSLAIPVGDIVVGYVGRFHHKKNIANVIKSFHLVYPNFPSVWLVLIGPNGNPEYMSLLRNETEAGAAKDRIVFWGPVSHDLVYDYLADIDLFVLPSYTENFGIAILEAMASMKPVVISYSVNIHQLISDYDAGFVVDTDVNSIASSILAFCRLSNLDRIEMGQRGRRLVETEYSPDAIANLYIRAYSSICRS